VPSRTQAERIARIRLREARAQATASITIGFNHIELQVGDWITWNSARFGLKTWRIVNRSVDATTRAVSLELAEINAAVYSWTAADEGVQPALPISLQPGERMVTVIGFGFQPVGIASGDGVTEIPGLRFFWSPISDPTVDGVLIEYRIIGTTRATRITDNSPGDNEHLATSGVVSGTDYEARATIVTTPPRATTWTAWVSGRTTDFFFRLKIGPNDMVPGIARELESLELAWGIADLAGESRVLAEEADERGRAAITEIAKVKVDTEMALADLTTTVEAQFDEYEVSVNERFTAVATITGQMVGRWSIVSNAGGYWGGMQLVTADGIPLPGGYHSEFKIAADNFIVGLPGAGFGERGIFEVGIRNGVLGIRMAADLISDKSINAPQINVDNLSAITANIGEVSSSPSYNLGGFLISGPARRLEIWDAS
jgi:hypothetical protein